jgi:hypothetical protein
MQQTSSLCFFISFFFLSLFIDASMFGRSFNDWSALQPRLISLDPAMTLKPHNFTSYDDRQSGRKRIPPLYCESIHPIITSCPMEAVSSQRVSPLMACPDKKTCQMRVRKLKGAHAGLANMFRNGQGRTVREDMFGTMTLR